MQSHVVGIDGEAAARERTLALTRRHPLPPGWSLEETFLQEITVGELRLCMAGLVAGDGASQALGSAAESDSYPVERAYFELLERVSIQEARRAQQLALRDRTGGLLEQRSAARVFAAEPAPERLRLALSNGVALQSSWQAACSTAVRELVERDRVLRSFAGELPVRPLPAEPCALAPEYRSAAYALGEPGPQLGLHVVTVVLSPRTPENPLVYGFGAAESLREARARAEREARQRLAFLWGEALPTHAPEPAPTPDFHQEHFLYPPHHAQLFAWLEGKLPPASRRTRPFDGDRLSFVDLTPVALHSTGLCVVKASSPHARKLRFGCTRGRPHPVV